MKRTEFTQIKGLSVLELASKAKSIRKEIADLIIDNNMKKLKDTRLVFKKRKDLAQVLTVIRQKQLLEQLESKSQMSQKSQRSKNGR